MRARLLAEYFLDRQPELIAGRLVRNAALCIRLGIETQKAVTLGDLGRFDREELLAAARRALSGCGKVEIHDIGGRNTVVARDEAGLVLKRAHVGEASVESRLDDLLIVSTSRKERSAALASLISSAGPTAPDFTDLLQAAGKRNLTCEEADRILSEAWGGVATLQARAAVALQTGDANVDNLVPGAMAYYDGFCGPDPSGADPEAYLTSTLPAYRRELLGRGLVRGLDNCLLGALRDDLSPGAWLQDVCDDELWAALEKCQPHYNPYSLLGALDVALGRQHDSRYRSFADNAMGTLASDQLPRPDGVDTYELLPLLARAVFNRVTMLEGGAVRPPYWRRMSAWMQAGLLGRLTLPLRLEMDQLRGWAAANEIVANAYARMLDLRQEPMLHAAEMSPSALRCEVVGRLIALRSRHEAAGRCVSRAGEIDAAMARLREQGMPLGWALPGPMEGHMQRAEALPADGVQQMIEALSDEADKSAWMRLAYFSQLFAFGPDLMECVRQAARGIALGAEDTEREQDFVRLEHACAIAAARRDMELARAIGTVILERAPTISTGRGAAAALGISVLAGAAFEAEAAWAVWLEEQLAETALRLPAGEPIEWFGAHLAALKQVLPMRYAIQSRAEALCAAAV